MEKATSPAMLTIPLRQAIKRRLPIWLLRWNKRRKWEPIRQHYAALEVADCFSDIYRTKLWGEADGEDYCSGTGSEALFAVPYVQQVQAFIAEHKIRTVVDLGCGDFRVGRLICAQSDLRYVGVDVVPDLIEYNHSRFGGPQVEFHCANLIDDELPDGDLCLIRQVLQHLSNAEIARVLAKCAKYRVVLVTEELFTEPGSRPNLDIAHGPDNRASDKSGVFLNLPPFGFKTTTILEIPVPGDKSVLRTVLLEGLTDISSRTLRETT
jgi:SAM-dependent methyltransferase